MNTRSITAICRVWVAVGVLLGATVVSAPAHAACNANPNARIDPDNQTVTERTGGNFTVVTLDGSKSTPNNPDLLFQWTYLGSTPAGLPVTLSSSTAQKPTFTSPNVPATGAALNFRLTVTCGTQTSSITTIVNVTDVFVNSPPTASFFISPLNATEGQVVTLDGTASSDPDGQSLAYTWTQIGGTPVVPLSDGNANGSIKTFIAPNLTATTTLTFRLSVSDGTLSNSIDKSVSILFTNDPPVAALTCPAGGVLERNEGQSATFDAGASTDPEGGSLTYAWSQNMGLPSLGIGGFTTPSITFTTPHLGYQQLGGMTVTVTVTDSQNVSASKSCGLFIKDVTAPVIVVPNDFTAEATSAAGANVPYSVTSQDAVEDALPNPLACVPPSSSLFALDAITPVNCTDQDGAGNVANASFNILVDDTTPPTLTVPGDTAVEAEGANGAIAHFTATKTDIVDGAAPAACTPATGSQFPLGDTTVNCTAVDAHGNAAEAKSFVLSVMDTTAPTIDPHGDEGPFEATSSAGAVVAYTAPATHDAVDGDGVATCTPPSGSTFALGANTVTCNAEDAAQNHATPTTFKVIVSDTTPPVIGAHGDITAEATKPEGADVSYDPPATIDAVDGAGVATCAPPSGSTFALGSHAVLCDATDAAGNPAVQTSFNITVVDTTPPVIASHANIPDVEATSAAGATVDYVAPMWTDAVSGFGPADCLPATGSTFALGATTVTCNAKDGANNAADPVTFTVEVVDTTPPAIDPVTDILGFEATGSSGAPVTFASPATHDAVDGDGTATCAPASGSTFGLGSTTVTCSATDAHDNSASRTFTVQVVDTTAPAIDAHGPVGPIEATGPSGAAVNYTRPTAHDIVDGSKPATCTPPPGATFGLGQTTVACNATDAAGNTAIPTGFSVTVVDTTPPVIAAHADVTVEATSALGAIVTYTSPATSDIVDGDGVASCAQASGTQFPVGDTTVTCNAGDAHGNAAAAKTFKVHVVDTTAPVIAPHADVNATATGNSSAVVNYTLPTASDLVDGPVDVTCTPVSGSTFNVGSTTVICNATDAAGNPAVPTTFKVIVSYTFNGFFQPIDNDKLNVVKAGSAIPVKFSLGGNQGLNIFAVSTTGQPASPASIATSCTAGQTDAIETTVTAGSSSLQYDPGADQYIYVWKTDKSWTGCRQLQVKLRDGSSRWATFSFTR